VPVDFLTDEHKAGFGQFFGNLPFRSRAGARQCAVTLFIYFSGKQQEGETEAFKPAVRADLFFLVYVSVPLNFKPRKFKRPVLVAGLSSFMNHLKRDLAESMASSCNDQRLHAGFSKMNRHQYPRLSRRR